ncbi:MAG: outer membrane protein assembly factor BamE [Aquabacterium sp.]|nr:MAG: outer membrane protein assembly factor BamE [Aquabacterium sp.]
MSIKRFRLLIALGALAMLGACGTSPRGEKFYGLFRPYRIEIVQGNVVTQEMMAQIQPGLGRAQVRDILGSPLLTDVFHADRWDYVFAIRRPGTEVQQRRVSVFFEGDKVARFEAGELPSEREFVASIDSSETPKVPPLELTPEQVRALPAPVRTAAPAASAQPAAKRAYPPLESLN